MPDNKCRCNYFLCDVSPLQGERFCTLHLKNDDKDLDEFTRLVEDKIEGDEEKIKLRGFYFPKNFPYDYFVGRDFNKPVHFEGVTFSNKVSFYKSNFLHNVNFFSTKFFQMVDFSVTTFVQKVNFTGAEFSEVDFRGTAFEKGADFSGAEFKDRASFLPVSENGEIKNVVFGGPSLFRYTRFTGEVIFQDVDLSYCSFLHSNIDKVDFRYCTFAKKGRRQNILRDELECDEKVAKNESDRKDYEHVRRLYLELKRNFEEKKDWNTAGDFHFGEMECRRQKMNSWWRRNIFSLEAIYFWASGYGERPKRAVVGLLILVLVIFPLLYMLPEGVCANVWRDSVNVATFMRLENPIQGAAGWGKFTIAVFELIFVPIQIALLALALRRKVKR